MDKQISSAIYYFSLFYFLYTLARHWRAIISYPTTLILAVLGTIGFIYGYRYLKPKNKE